MSHNRGIRRLSLKKCQGGVQAINSVYSTCIDYSKGSMSKKNMVIFEENFFSNISTMQPRQTFVFIYLSG